MRRTLMNALVAALAITIFGSTPSWAQSGSRGIAPTISNAAQALAQPTITSATPMATAPMLQAEQAFSAPVMGAPTYAAPMMGQSVVSPAMSYTGPVSGTYNPGPPSNAYGPLAVGPYPQGRACCDLTPTPTVIPQLQPVTSCCSQNGRLGVPPLLTPIRYDTPPIGRSVGRPLFGRWNGF